MGWPALTLTHARARRWLGLHFERQLGPRREARLRRHLAGCSECRPLYMALAMTRGPETARERHQRLEASLFGPRRPGPRRRASGRRTLTWPAVAAAAAVLLLVVLVAPLLRDRGRPEFLERGSLTTDEDPTGASRYVSIVVYRHPEEGPIQPVRNGDAISRRDRLAFAYTNLSEEGFDRLLLFGIDEQHVVYWFYPAWTDPARIPPRAVSIRHDRGVELPEEVAHDYEGSRLRLFALFFSGRRDLSVRSIEAVVRQLKERKVRVENLQRFPLQETGQHTILLRVTDR